ncbi:heavy metal translocating P-type ATPase [Anaerobutyricum hallii]|uniref:Cd(2+)-exporting ATPase n=2 Tax=Anaerobutyricum hallii TaxID=39488 RepID=A0A414B1S4_9FIRM|nr:heavy metal translocating P-type ATPase [Anaerobutyricum hallii]
MQRKVYILENLDCANCAAKIERKLSKLPELSDVSVTFATKQLRFAAEDPEAVLPKIRETIQSMEPDVEVVERTRSRRKAAETHNHEHHHHEHGEECGCGHDHHDHDHDHEEHEHHHHEHGEECGCGHDHHDHDHDHEGHEHHHHHHEHGEECGCGHDHDHDHEEHDHHHHHEHGEECGCGHDHHDHDHDHEEHDHHHHHEHGEECGCGHDHHDHDHDHEEHDHHHHHEHGEECGCGHDHHDHDHHHHHDHGPAKPQATRSHTHFQVDHHQVEGHPEGCQCEQCNSYVEYCDVCGESLAKCNCHMPDEDLEKKVYILEGIDCANCAAKIEAKIRQMPEVGFASVAFATKQLRVSANNQAELLPKMQAVVDSIEDGVTIVPRQRKKLSGISNTKVYILEGLDCANCAAKIEAKLRTLNGVDDLTITYATKQMKLSAKNPDQMIPMIKETIDAMEDGITIVPKDNKVIKSEEAGEKKFSFNNPLVSIGVGAGIFIIGEILEHVGNVPTIPMFALFLIAYLVLGGKVLITAGKNIMKGQVFDENFLMCIATIGAFCIQEFPEAVGVMLFYRIGEYFEEKATEQSRTQIMEAVDLRPEVVNLVIGNDVRIIDAEEANVGDILLVRPGDRIPLDGVIIDGESRIDTSPVTGEPVPVMAKTGDNIVSGCVNTSGQLKIRVEKILEESMVTRILDSVENAAASKPNIDKFITRFARVYTPFVVLFALFVAVVLPFILPDSLNWHFFVDSAYTGTVNTIHGTSGTASIYTALTFLVISCPCALVLSVPLAFFSGIGAGSKKGILFKGGIAIESLKNVKAIVMDKTGTITKGNFVVQKANPAGNAMTANDLLAISASCELSSTHPIGNSIVEAAEEKGLSIERPSKVEEIAGHGIRAELSRGVVLCGNRKLMDAQNVDLSAYQKENFGTEVLVAVNGKFVGNIVISDTVKDDAKDAIAAVKKQGIITAMLTGDAQESADAVAKETGIDEVHAKLLPQDKLSELKKIRENHGAVMFVGDGINDAPVLAGADVGAAMGSGADAAIEAADVVFMNSEMKAIPEAVGIAKMTNSISWQNVVFALAIKIIVMIMGLFGFANMWIAVFADTGVSVLCLLNSIRILHRK